MIYSASDFILSETINDPEIKRCLHHNPIKEKVISVQHLIIATNYDLIESAVLAIVRTTNSIVKLDSSVSF